LRRPSAERSAVPVMMRISSGGVSFGFAASNLAARLVTSGDAIDLPESATLRPPGR